MKKNKKRLKREILKDIADSQSEIEYNEYILIPKLIKELADGYRITKSDINEFELYEYM